MRNQAPAIAVRVIRSRFLLVTLLLVWLLLLTLLILIWNQGNLSQWAGIFSMFALLGLALSLLRCYAQFFVGSLSWNGLSWILHPALNNSPGSQISPESITLTCVWDGQAHMLLWTDKNWIWLDAAMFDSMQWLALRRALLKASFGYR